MENYFVQHVGNGLIKIGFVDGAPASNDILVQQAHVLSLALKSDSTLHGNVARINGPASLPVAMAIASNICHVVPAVACFDPKLGCYVVAISHSPNYSVGDLID